MPAAEEVNSIREFLVRVSVSHGRILRSLPSQWQHRAQDLGQ